MKVSSAEKPELSQIPAFTSEFGQTDNFACFSCCHEFAVLISYFPSPFNFNFPSLLHYYENSESDVNS